MTLLETAAKSQRPLTGEERSTLDSWRTRADELFAEQAAIDSQRTDLDAWEKRMLPGLEPSTGLTVIGAEKSQVARTVGQQVVEAPGFAEYKSRRLPYSVEVEIKAATPGGSRSRRSRRLPPASMCRCRRSRRSRGGSPRCSDRARRIRARSPTCG